MSINYPIRVGITGHRSLTEVEKKYVGKEISKTFAILRRNIEIKAKAAGIKNDFFLSGITSLAEGADRVFAAEILNASGALEVVLPFKKEIFLQDFWGAESESEFLNFMNYDPYPLVIDNSDNPCKELAYHLAAKCIVDQSDILIVIWDESPDKATLAGTEKIMEYARQSKIPTVILFPRPNNEKDLENMRNLDSIDISGYKSMATEWLPIWEKFENYANRMPGIEAIKETIIGNNYTKLNKLLVWQRMLEDLSTTMVKRSRRLSRAIYSLVASTGLVAILAYWLRMLELNKSGKLLDVAATALTGVEGILLLILMMMLVTVSKSLNDQKPVLYRLWADKMKTQVYKISTLTNDYECLDENYGEELFQNRSLFGRLFLYLSKDAWSNFMNSIDFKTRADMLKMYVKQNTSPGASVISDKQNRATNEYNTAIIFLTFMGFIGVAGLLITESLNGNLAFGKLHEFLQFIGLIFPAISLVIYLVKKTNKPGVISLTHGKVQTDLREIEKLMPELCNTEEDLACIFKRFEGAMLGRNIEWSLLVHLIKVA